MSSPNRILVNGRPDGMIDPLDRGLAYGDGVFETIRFVGRMSPLWSRHMQRLQDSCTRLRIPCPEPERLWQEALVVTQGLGQAVVRITMTRGAGERGYALPAAPQPTRVLAAFPAPIRAVDDYRHGLRVRLCETRLAIQPRLAGIKHLNRLEQVLARAEWDDPAIAEGLLCDEAGRVISAVMANLFAVIDGVLITPSLERCGVNGVARAEVQAVREVQVCDLSLGELWQASELFLSSSVHGMLPVRSVDDKVFVPGPVTRALQQHWCELGFPTELA
ncbi:aminodeoxychorismate lyase [Dyella tabacisoli]|uniref:Aminodeoxychorismate lyase n=1 Tax=Dyella tabacisoli TaxID=2282381 RepID=A0A369UKR3_9GAMM|nr:aminodeoxychorismate lyase [Dyella tabacisoli]RDD81156.1 aminodeoxychorismate lyase [Dyella tabacisoli]